jgi:hypothetical protein
MKILLVDDDDALLSFLAKTWRIGDAMFIGRPAGTMRCMSGSD